MRTTNAELSKTVQVKDCGLKSATKKMDLGTQGRLLKKWTIEPDFEKNQGGHQKILLESEQIGGLRGEVSPRKKKKGKVKKNQNNMYFRKRKGRTPKSGSHAKT